MEDSPAERAGLQVGDVIIEFNGKKVTRSNELPPLVGRTPVGEDARVTIIRNKSKRTIRVKIAQLPADVTKAETTPEPEPAIEKSALGMSVKELDRTTMRQLKIDSGVLVTEIEDGGPAQQAGIVVGDVISMIDNRSIASVKEFEQRVDELKPGKSVAILIQRSNGPVFLAIKPQD